MLRLLIPSFRFLDIIRSKNLSISLMNLNFRFVQRPMGTFVLRAENLSLPYSRILLPTTVMASTPFPVITTGAVIRLGMQEIYPLEDWEILAFQARWDRFPEEL